MVVIARYVALPVDMPEVSVFGVRESGDWHTVEGARQYACETISESTFATVQTDTLPVIMDFLPGEFDPVRDLF